MVEELFQDGVCGGTWRNPTLFSGGGGSTLCSVAQLGGGCYDISGFGWSHEIMKSSRFNNNDTLFCDNNIDNNNNDKNYIYNNNNNNNNINNLVFSADFDSTFDILGFGISPTTSTIDWNKKNPFCKSGNSKESYDDRSIFHGSLNSKSNYEDLGPNIQKLIDSTKFPNQNESQYTTMTTSSNNSPGDNSSSISYEDGMAIQINSSTSYLIQTLFDDNVDNEPLGSIPQPISRLIDPINDFAGSMDRHQVSNCSWDKSSCDNISIPLVQSSNSDYNTATISSDIRAAFNLKSLTCADNHSTKLKHEETRHESKKNSNNDQPTAKRARIETPSSLPTFKVRKEKLGDRITALQQLVSPFGKTDTASVLHEAIEYIKFLHDQVHVLSTPYFKNGEMFVEHRQVSDDNEELDNKDLRSRGLCLVPISSTYPVTHETPIDFWTPKFG